MICAVLVALFVADSLAHNWVNSWSRSPQANTIAPALPSATGQPHVQVRAGQTFQIEWVVGHGSDVFFTLLSKADSAKMAEHTNTMMNDYINKAPPAQQKTPNGKYMKYHRKADNSLVWDGDDKTWAGKTYFKSEVKPTNSDYIKRDATFGGSFKGAPKNRGTDFHNATLVHQMVYPDECRENDRLVEYKNADYPWVIAMARYNQCLHMPNRPDVALFSFPAGTPPGDYVVHYRWRGYYDAIDVNIIAAKEDTSHPYGEAPPAGAKEPQGEFKRIDHCQFLGGQLVTSCVRVITSAETCSRTCGRMPSAVCDAVNVVPMKHASSIFAPFREQPINIPFANDNNNCKRSNIVRPEWGGEEAIDENTFVCYGLKSAPPSDIGVSYHVTDDPDDPAFYSTCYLRKPVVTFAAPPTEEVDDTPPQWNFNGRCVDCAFAKRNKETSVVPIWPIIGESGKLKSGSCANCDARDVKAAVQAPDARVPKTTIVKAKSYCDGRFGSWKNATYHTCENPKTSCPIRLSNSRASVNVDNLLNDCVELAKRDERCSNVITVRSDQTINGRLDCYCYRKDLACCKTCNFRSSNNWNVVRF